MAIIAIAGTMLAPVYFIYPQYDKLLHLFMPILYASIVFYIVSHLKLELKWKLLITFFIVIGIIGIFEVIEYLLDLYLDVKLQGVFLRDPTGLEKLTQIQSKIDDTMIDMIIGIIGSLTYLFSVLFFSKK